MPQRPSSPAPARRLPLALLLCGTLFLLQQPAAAAPSGTSSKTAKNSKSSKSAKQAKPAKPKATPKAKASQARKQALAAPGPTCPPVAKPPSPEALQAAQARASDRGLLWRLSKDGRQAYLYGSIHVGKLDWAIPGPKLAAALQDSDMLALELDPADPAVQQQMSAGLSLRRLEPDAPLRQRLERHEAKACLPKGSLAAIPHPLMQAFTLTLVAARWEGLDPAYAQEQVLSGMAHSVQRPVVSLETVELQLDALLPREPAEAMEATSELLDLLEQDKARPVLKRLAEAWERSDLETLANYEQWCECARNAAERAQLQRLNDERNPNLAERIDALIQAGHRPFAAVGALHMTGPQALPRLLEQRGYQLERLQ
ncbi:MAG: TraB/GumN family protein [Roseateles sp.]